jgi:phosphoribosyl 1,2-cyclic phosphate phosphodiesterase
MGVPRSDSYFGNCDSKEKKNFRSRCSALIKSKNETILIDTSPDLRQQLLNHNIRKIDKVFYSHMHADQTHGINDLRVFYLLRKKAIPVYADNATKKYLLHTFRYCFKGDNKEYPATLKLKSINDKLTLKNGKKTLSIKPIKVRHGKVDSICYIFDKKLAYISDISEIKKKDFKYFNNLKYLIIDCLWFKQHPAHLNFDKCLMYINKFKPKRTILTNLHSDLDYNHLKHILPKNIFPAYDGLTIKL